MPRRFRETQQSDTGKGKGKAGPRPLDLTRPQSSDVGSTQDTSPELEAVKNGKQELTKFKEICEDSFKATNDQTKPFFTRLDNLFRATLKQFPDDEHTKRLFKIYMELRLRYKKLEQQGDVEFPEQLDAFNDKTNKILESTNFSSKKKIELINSEVNGTKEKIKSAIEFAKLSSLEGIKSLQDVAVKLEEKGVAGSSSLT